ncbi:MAG: M50 family metallopeptidase [Clostridia bacterium]|nr:M50 family metallopeptidase [Clostridia bacterium]
MTIWTILLALLILSLLVVVHELGHYLVGRWLGFTIVEYSVGMGPKLLHRKSKKTGITYSLRALPIGGMCQFFGEDEDAYDPRCFNNHAWWKRALVIVAGPFMNFLIALLLAIIMQTAYGYSLGEQVTPYISAVTEGSAAAEAGLEEGDVFVAINGVEIVDGETLSDAMGIYVDRADVTVERGGETLSFELTGIYSEEEGRNIMGISYLQNELEKYSFGQALIEAPKYCIEMVALVYESFGMLITGQVGLDEMAGPAGVIMVISQYVPQGLEIILALTVMISVNLGVVNLFPFPALDGGRLIFILIEGIFKKRVPPKVEGIIHAVGMALLLLLILLLTINDVGNCFGGLYGG